MIGSYAKRLQIQERLTTQIADVIEKVLQPQGVAVVIKATHGCMTTRGVHKRGETLVTSRMLGVLRDNASTRHEFMTSLDIQASRIAIMSWHDAARRQKSPAGPRG